MPGRQKIGHDILDLTQETELHLLEELRTATHVRSPQDDRFVAGVGQGDDPFGVRLLGHHIADHDHVGPVEVAVMQIFDVAIDQPHLPLVRQERGHRNHSQRRGRIFLSRDSACFPVVPERVGTEAWKHHQDIGGIIRQRSSCSLGVNNIAGEPHSGFVYIKAQWAGFLRWDYHKPDWRKGHVITKYQRRVIRATTLHRTCTTRV